VHAADVVERQLGRRAVAVHGLHVDPVADVHDRRAHGARRVLERVARSGAQRGVGHPAHPRLDLACDLRAVRRSAEHRAARDVEVVLEAHGHRLWRERLVQRAVEGVDAGHARAAPGG
jgi:hypothetical protein